MDFLRVRTEILNDLSTDLRETLPEELGSNHIAWNHLVRKILRIISAVLMNSNPAPRDLTMVLKRIHTASRNHATLVILAAMNVNLERTLLLHMNPIGFTEESATTAPKKRRDPQTEDSLCGSEDKIHYLSLMGCL